MRRLILILFLLVAVAPMRGYAQWNVGQLLRIGTDAIYYDDKARAIEHFNRIIRLKPRLHEPYFFRGYAKLGLDDINGALEDFTRAIDINPNYLLAYVYRGMAYYQAGRYEESLEDYRVAAELAPSESMIYAYRGLTYRALGSDELAEKDYSKSIRLNADQEFAYLNRAVIREKRGDDKGAMEDCNSVLRRNIFSSDAYSLRGYINKKLGNYHDAMEDYNRGIKADPENMQLRMNRAFLHYEQKHYYDALAEYDEMLSVDSNYVYALYNRALLRLELGATNNAIEDFSRVLEMNPENILVYFNRGLAHQSIKAYSEAYNDFSNCIALYPDFAKAYNARAALLYDMNRDEEAMADLYAANEIIDRYHQMKQGVAGAFVDTTQNFTRLLDLNDRSSAMRDLVSGKAMEMISVARLKGLYRITVLPVDSVNTTNTDKYDAVVASYNATHNNETCITIASKPLVQGVRMLNPDRADELLYAGVALLDSEKFMEAIALFEQVGKDSEWYAAAQFSLANARALMYMYIERLSEANIVLGKQKERKIDFSNEIAIYDECLRLNPSFLYAKYNKAVLMAESGEVIKAVELFDQVLSVKPDFADAYFNRGILNLYLGEKRKAIQDLSRAGELGINDAYNIIKRYGNDI